MITDSLSMVLGFFFIIAIGGNYSAYWFMREGLRLRKIEQFKKLSKWNK